MGQSSSTVPEKVESQAAPASGEKKKLKPCCACPETRKARDEWSVVTVLNILLVKEPVLSPEKELFLIAEKGQENCQELIDAHIACMRKEGFNI